MSAKFTADPTGKPSTMRATAMFAAIAGVVMMLGAAFGLATFEVGAQDVLWLIGIALGGKAAQRAFEGADS